MSLDPELLEIFRQETDERLDRMIDTLLAVEAGTAAPDAIDQLFRDAHSIKGNAGMVGFTVAAKVAGAVEDILESAREANALDPALTAPLLRATDAIRAAVEGQDEPCHRRAGRAVGDGRGRSRAGRHPGPCAGDRAVNTPANPARGGRPRRPAARCRRRDRPASPPARARAGANGARRRPEPSRGVDRGDVLLEELQGAVVRMRTLPLASIAPRDLAARRARHRGRPRGVRRGSS